jgi:hypothetical protein
MFVQSGPLGTMGLISDPPDHTLPIGAWSNVRNIRFDNGFAERAYEPTFLPNSEPVNGQPPVWVEQWADSAGPQVAYASVGKIFKFNQGTEVWDDVSKGGGTYNPGTWQSFPWGTSVVFNNGANPPQILYEGATEMVDLPNWGIITDPADPGATIDTQALAACIRPYRNFLVAINIQEQLPSNLKLPNRVWWSGPANRNDSSDPALNPSWDYTQLSTLSGIATIGVEDGPLIDQLLLAQANVIYTKQSAYLMQFTQDTTFVFTFERTLDYGITNIHAVANHDNVHICAQVDSIYQHDGSTIQQLTDGKIQDIICQGYTVPGSTQIEHNQQAREIHIKQAINQPDSNGDNSVIIIVYNYRDQTFSLLDGFTNSGINRAQVAAMSYGSRSTDVTVWDELDPETWSQQDGKPWLSYWGVQDQRRLYWVNGEGLSLGAASDDYNPTLNPDKSYILERTHIDLSTISPQITSNVWKHLREVYPHIDTDVAGNGNCEIRASWANTLVGPALNTQTRPYDPFNNYKIDFRITGRYLGLRINVTTGGKFRLTSMDYDVEMVANR